MEIGQIAITVSDVNSALAAMITPWCSQRAAAATCSKDARPRIVDWFFT